MKPGYVLSGGRVLHRRMVRLLLSQILRLRLRMTIKPVSPDRDFVSLSMTRYEACTTCYGVYFDAGEFKDYKEETILGFFKDLFTKERV